MATQQQIRDAFEAGQRAAREGKTISSCVTYTGKNTKADIKAAFMKGYLQGLKK